MLGRENYQEDIPSEYKTSPTLEAMYRLGQSGYHRAVRFSQFHPQDHLHIYDGLTYEIIADVKDQKRIVIGDAVIEAISYGEKKGGEIRISNKVYYFVSGVNELIDVESISLGVTGE